MNGNIDIDLTKVKQSSLQEEITEPNDSETDETTLIESENDLMQKDRTVRLAGATIKPPPIKQEIFTEPKIIV
ncbi:MAG: hypothetical protein V7K98_20265 [Nostoc sp.]|uniref:hypothetical protein n=1 Tax=Nostoc sp. TaxID=1180 RepID=UPI002FF8BFCE